MKSSEKSDLPGLRTIGLLRFFLFLVLIIGCTPSVSTRTATLIPASTSRPNPLPTSTLSREDSPAPQVVTSTQIQPTLKFNSWEIVHDLVYSPDGSVLAVSAGNRIHIYNGETLGELADVQVRTWTNRIAFHPKLPLIILAVKNGTLQFRETFSGDLVCQFTAHEKGANSLAIHPDGALLITTGTDLTSRLWDISTLAEEECRINEIGTLIGESYSSPDAAFAPDGNSIALVDLSNIRLRKTSDRKLIALLESDLPIFDIAFSPDGRWLAAAQHLDSVALWDLSHADNPVATFLQPPKADHEAYSWRVAFSPDSKLLAAGASDGSITLWDLSDLRIIETHNLPRAVTALAFSQDSSSLAAGGLDASIWLFPVGQK